MKVCFECGKTYSNTSKVIFHKKCDSLLIDVDELMIPIVLLFNNKGYETTHCCSGHINDKYNFGGYININREVKIDKKKYPLLKLEIGKDNQNAHWLCTIRCGYDSHKWSKDIPYRYKILNEFHQSLYKLAEELA